MYIAIAKHCWVIKLWALKSDQKYFDRSIRKFWEPQKIIATVGKFLTNVCIVEEDFQMEFCSLFYLQFLIQVISEKTLCSKGFAGNLRGIFYMKVILTVHPTH